VIPKEKIRRFRKVVWNYYRAHGRDLPWRRTRDPYHVVVSEIMLQQTQVERVRGRYESFLHAFPSFYSLAKAPVSAVLRAWQGLGYNRRALALHRLAKIVAKEHGGKSPRTPETLKGLPGVGPATAGSIAAFAFNTPVAFIETNIRRAIIHHFFPRRRNVSEKEVMAIAEAALGAKNPREWHWALMDYGSMLGKAVVNPNRRSAKYRRQPAFKGSVRELRGRIVRLLAEKSRVAIAALSEVTRESSERVVEVVNALEREGFLRRSGTIVMLQE
jgi:A/G-specific adenine glycosylase